MAYGMREARSDLLADVGDAIEALGAALAALGGAFEVLDDATAERLEEELFRPVQVAYGRAQRTYAGFADGHGLPARSFPPAGAGPPSQTARAYVDRAIAAVEEADGTLAALQDSMRPVEVGDAALRAGLAEVRELIGDLRVRADRLIRTLGR